MAFQSFIQPEAFSVNGSELGGFGDKSCHRGNDVVIGECNHLFLLSFFPSFLIPFLLILFFPSSIHFYLLVIKPRALHILVRSTTAEL